MRHSVVRSAGLFFTHGWWLLLGIIPAAVDAGGLMRTLGLISDELDWLTPTGLRWLFFIIAVIVAFWWFHLQRARFDVDLGEGEIDLQDVVRHISERSRWALNQPHETDDWPVLVRAELLTRLSRDSRLPAFGHFRQSKGHSPEDGQRRIDADFWRDPE